MKKILVPCDFSDTSKQAFFFALQIAERTNAEVLVLKAIDMPFSYESSYAAGHFYNSADLLKQLEDGARKSYEGLMANIGENENIHFSVVQGPVTDVIRTVIDNEHVDLVVMGTHGSSGVKESFIGSNTEKIVRFSPVPVISIHNAVNMDSLTDIVVPTDTETFNPGFIAALKELQELLGAKLHLLLISTEYRLLKSHELMDRLADFAASTGLNNYTLNLHRHETNEGAIIEFAGELNAGMIAMATHGRRGLSHLYMGSLAEDVVNHVNYPVWTYSVRKNAPLARSTNAGKDSVKN